MAFETLAGFLRKKPSGGQALGALVVTTDPADPLTVASESTLMTAATYSGGLMATYTEQRDSDGLSRTVTITRNGDGTIASQVATAWA